MTKFGSLWPEMALYDFDKNRGNSLNLPGFLCIGAIVYKVSLVASAVAGHVRTAEASAADAGGRDRTGEWTASPVRDRRRRRRPGASPPPGYRIGGDLVAGT